MAARRLTEWLGRAAVLVLAAGPPSAVGLAHRYGAHDGVTLRGVMPEAGGWQPAALTATVGDTLHLRLTSGDVIHGFAIGRHSVPPVEVKPGQVTELALRFDRPGTYAFYCTRWCGPSHWRMRGTIEVTGPGIAVEAAAPAPYLALGVDIDTPHPAGVRPDLVPSAVRGLALDARLREAWFEREYVRRHSPAQVWRELRASSGLRALPDQQVWDLVTLIWRANASNAQRDTGRRLYARNCAACHGPAGRGDGVMALARSGGLSAPPDFTDPGLLGASPVLLQGKIVRGGMGTGMPAWGAVLTDAEIWALVDFLYGFQFAYDTQGGLQ